MKVWIFCNNYTNVNLETCKSLFAVLESERVSYSIYRKLEHHLKTGNTDVFDEQTKDDKQVEVLISVGGDGTILSAIPLIRENTIPILGINTGRLGFLTSIAPAEFGDVLREIMNGKYVSEERALLEVEPITHGEPEISLALNEISVLKKDSSSMITIHAEVDGQFLNTYWADGLIVATATGSTAYSLSCGGPIVEPGSGNFIITPIAPHNLNVRPLVIPDNRTITLSFNSRSQDLMVAVDSSSRIIPHDAKIKIYKSQKKIRLLRLNDYNYFETLRKKLNWGLDQRN